MPYQTLFPGQESDEKIIMILRRHGWILFKIIFIYGLLMFLPFFFQAVLQNSSTIFETELGPTLYKLCVSIYYLALVTFFFRAWLDYYLDIWVITDERIVNIEQKGLFSREISTQRLYRIQDVTAEVKGVIATFFHFGNVYVQTAGEEQRFIFKQIPDPYHVTKKIMELVDWKKKTLGNM